MANNIENEHFKTFENYKKNVILLKDLIDEKYGDGLVLIIKRPYFYEFKLLKPIKRKNKGPKSLKLKTLFKAIHIMPDHTWSDIQRIIENKLNINNKDRECVLCLKSLNDAKYIDCLKCGELLCFDCISTKHDNEIKPCSKCFFDYNNQYEKFRDIEQGWFKYYLKKQNVECLKCLNIEKLHTVKYLGDYANT